MLEEEIGRSRKIKKGAKWRAACTSEDFGKFEKWDLGVRRIILGNNNPCEKDSNRAGVFNEAVLYIIHVSPAHPLVIFPVRLQKNHCVLS